MTKDALVQYLRKYVAFKKEYSCLEAREYYLRNTIPKLLKKPDVTYESQDESIIGGVVAFNFVFDLFLAPFIAIFLGFFLIQRIFFMKNFIGDLQIVIPFGQLFCAALP